MRTSIFEIFKIGIGPSSSHTMGPMRAAEDFVATLARREVLLNTRRVQIDLYGSLALTGRGHGTDGALLLGLCGELPDVIDPDTIAPRLQTIRSAGALPLRGVHPIQFDESRDLISQKEQTLPGHSNGMRFQAFDGNNSLLAEQVYYSIGGGFILIRQAIEVIDVSTPATVIRYTRNWKGSMEGWLLTPRTGFASLRKTLPGLRRFLMVGQWIMPGGGLPSGLLTARSAIQEVCKQDRVPFAAGRAAAKAA